jgi:hypothetical protein
VIDLTQKLDAFTTYHHTCNSTNVLRGR